MNKGCKLYVNHIMVLIIMMLAVFTQYANAGVGVAIKSIKSGGDFNNGIYEEELIDIQVKVLGGYVMHTRFLKGGVTQFNPNWASLNFEFYDGNESSFLPDVIYRNRFEYVRKGSSNTYVFDERNFIVKTDSGYSWKNRKGDLSDYDNEGVILSYANRNDVTIFFTRDSEGRISSVKDHNGDIVLSYTYNANGSIEKVTDYTNRSVSYTYQNMEVLGNEGGISKGITSRGVIRGELLSKVTDVLGNDWEYFYVKNILVKRTAPDGQALELSYSGLERPASLPDPDPSPSSSAPQATICSDWVGDSWSRDSSGWSMSQECLSSSSSGGGTTTSQINPEDRIPYMIRGMYINGERVKSYTYLYNKNKKTWLRSVVDGDNKLTVTELNEAGELLSINKNGRQVMDTLIRGNNYIVSDENRNMTTYLKDVFKNNVKVTFADGTKITRTYNTKFSLVTSYINENGVETKYNYDSHGNQTERREAAGTANEIVTTYVYDSFGQGTKNIYAKGSNEKWLYDNKGNTTSYTNGEDHTTLYTDYDALGNAQKVTDPRGNTTEYIYDAAGNITQSKSPLGNIKKYEYDGRGNLVKYTNANNKVTNIVFDVRNRATQVTNPLSETSYYSYNSRGQVTLITDAAGKKTQIEYDLDGHVIKVVDGNNNQIEVDYGYLNLKPYKSLLNKINYPGYQNEREYDKRNRVTKSMDSSDGEADRVKRYRYDNVGNVTKITNPKGNQTNLEYDVHNRIIKSIDPDQQTTQFVYDAHHNVSKVINANNNDIRTYEYNKLNKITRQILADNAEYQKKYDANGNVVRQIDAKGQVLQYEYDADNRLIKSRTFNTIAQAADNTNTVKTTIYTYNNTNQLTAYDDGITSGSYIYDAANRLIEFSINYGSFTKTSKYSYYPNGKKKTFTAPSGQTTTYHYDANNQLQRITIAGQGSITVNENNWLAPKTITYPGGIKQNISHDGYLRTTQIKTQKTDNTALLNHQYEYDAYDNLTLQSILAGSRMGPSNYEYDKEDRLTQYTNPAYNTQSASTIKLSYDGVGNRLTDNRDANPNTWEYDSRDRLKKRGKLNYAYDQNGSLLTITHTDTGLQKSFEYNLDNRLTKVKDGANNTIASYQYDPFGRRVSKTVAGNTTYFFYNQEGLVAEMDNAGAIQTQYGYRPHGTWGTNPLFIKQAGYVGYYQNDQLGTPQQVVTASGQVIWDAHYSAFGQATVTTQTITNNLRLAGQYFDGETGLHYNYFRYYDPEIGRYLRSDPISLAGGINAYGYVKGNPISRIDPLGLFDIHIGGDIDLVVGIGIELGVGIVFDTDNLRDSGVYGSGGVAVGFNIGASLGGGVTIGGDIEGDSVGVDGNVGAASVSVSYGEDGGVTISGGIGPGIGGSANATQTGTITVGSVIDFFDCLF